MFRVVTVGAVCFLMAGSALAQGNVRVDGYTRRDGTYVAPHYRTAPDSSRTNNFGSQGNYNPYTGQQGTVNPYQPPQPTYQPPSQGFGSTNRDRRY